MFKVELIKEEFLNMIRKIYNDFFCCSDEDWEENLKVGLSKEEFLNMIQGIYKDFFGYSDEDWERSLKPNYENIFEKRVRRNGFMDWDYACTCVEAIWALY